MVEAFGQPFGQGWPQVADLFLALVLSTGIGLERELRQKSAGLRTYTLVGLGAALFSLAGAYGFQDELGNTGVPRDPSRVAAQVVSGIGFIGAGLIFVRQDAVRGLTTAASIWITSVIGILAGIGFYVPLVATTIMTVGVLSVFRWIEARISSQSYAQLEIGFSADASMAEGDLRRFVGANGFHPVTLNYSYSAATQKVEYALVMWTLDSGNLSRLAEALTAEPKVREFRLLPMGD